MAILDDAERAAALGRLPGWRYDEARKGIARGYRFAGFADAFAFMARVALEAEKADHHPEWTNVWNRVDVLLTTHSAGGVTPRDLALAEAMDAAAARLAPEPPST